MFTGWWCDRRLLNRRAVDWWNERRIMRRVVAGRPEWRINRRALDRWHERRINRRAVDRFGMLNGFYGINWRGHLSLSSTEV
jgi:hypothetical protein